MNKKKIAALLVAGVMTIGVVGGTLAWFTSQDSVTNVFNTGSVTDPDGDGADAGIEIEENFPGATKDPITGEMVYNKPVLPGDILTKEVKVTSTATYDQFLRAKITKVWKDENGKEVTHYFELEKIVEASDADKLPKGSKKVVFTNSNSYTPSDEWKVTENKGVLNYDYIVLGLSTDLDDGFDDVAGNDSWTASAVNMASPEFGYYYYNAILKGNKTETEVGISPVDSNKYGYTSQLLKTVTLSKDADKFYKNLQFDVKVEAESIQTSNGAAAAEGWSQSVPASTLATYKNN